MSALACTINYLPSWKNTMRNPSLHWSDLKNIGESPAYYRHRLDNPHESAAMQFGTCVHRLVLGGDSPVVFDGATRRGKAWDAFEAANPGALIVTAKELDRAAQCAKAVLSDPVAAPLLRGRREEAWATELYGRPCASRGIDVLGDGFIADLKTARTVKPARFVKAALAMGYHAQLAFYRAAARKLGHAVNACHIIGVESVAPFQVTVMSLTERTLEQGERLNTLWLERLAACEAADEWPGYVQSPVEVDVEESTELDFGDDDEESA